MTALKSTTLTKQAVKRGKDKNEVVQLSAATSPNAIPALRPKSRRGVHLLQAKPTVSPAQHTKMASAI